MGDVPLRRTGANVLFRARRSITPSILDSTMLIAQIANEATHITHTGIGLGAAIAVVCSWQRNRSIGYAILAGILSWIYVIYFAITRKADETNASQPA
jgi:hypothetical protein